MTEGGRRADAGRISDYLLGNGHSLAADRRLAGELERAVPDIRQVVQLGRMFLRSTVTYLVREEKVRQFLKFGSDIPTVGSAHLVAQAVDPGCRVVYVDTDPIAVTHSRMLLGDTQLVAAVHAEPRDFDTLADHPETSGLLDLTMPVGLLLVDVLRFLPESCDPPSVIARCANRFAPGSHLAIAHLTGHSRPAEAAALTEVMSASHDPVRPRTHAEIMDLFSGFELVGPGVADVGQWYGERRLTSAEQAAATQFYVGIGRKPLPQKEK
jgi:hypothetical protein